MIAMRLLQFGKHFGKGLFGRFEFHIVVVDRLASRVADHSGHAELELPRLDDAKSRRDWRIETEQRRIGRDERARVIGHVGHGSGEPWSGQPQIVGPERDRPIVHRLQRLGRPLEFDLRLRAEPADLVADIQRHDSPTLGGKLLEKAMSAAQPTPLVLLARAAARLDVAPLQARGDDDGFGLGPIFERSFGLP